MDEFSLINTYFKDKQQLHIAQNQAIARKHGVVLGIGDDAAVFDVPSAYSVVSSHDSLLQGVHFPEDCSPENIAQKALAVNLSDLAAMGAIPHSFSLSLSLPEINTNWLAGFSKSLFEYANTFELALIGGDTVRGNLALGIQINGLVPNQEFLRRDTLHVGDLICVTGTLGLAALGLQQWNSGMKDESLSHALSCFLKPQPRVDFARGLFELGVRACIDISDGFLVDLSHMLDASAVCAQLQWEDFLIHPELKLMSAQQQQQLIFSGGDDYELCFSVRPEKYSEIETRAETLGIPLACVGKVVQSASYRIVDVKNNPIQVSAKGYNHFPKQGE